MKITDQQLMIVIRGLCREGHRTMTIKQIQERCREEKRNYRLRQQPDVVGCPHVVPKVSKWLEDAVKIRTDTPTATPRWDVWWFQDRLCKAITRLAKTGCTKVVGKKCKTYGYTCNSKVHLRDYTNTQIFGDDRLRAALYGV
jgi:hypothetical protein